MNILPHKPYKALLIGDSCTDVYHYGTCSRLSPEAPVPVFKENRWEERPGMAANVLSNLQAFKIEVEHITNIEKIEKHRYIDERFKQHLLRVDKNETQLMEQIDLNQLQNLKNVDIVLISDYNKGLLSYENCMQISDLCNEQQIPLFVDSKKTDLSCFKKAILKINESESQKVKDVSADSELIITLGDKGCKYKDVIYETNQVEVFDVCGAGDVFISALAFEYLNSNNFIKAIQFANKCASYSVTKFGTYVLTKEDVDDLCV